jgi:LacI family transcriptional regulator
VSDGHETVRRPLTIYDVARAAGVSIASVSRVLNGYDSPRPETRERVMRAVSELGFVPDGAARALSNRLKEVVAVVFRRAVGDQSEEGLFESEDENLLFADMINRGVELAAQLRGYDLLMSSVNVLDQNPGPRLSALAGKSDGIILHDQVLTPAGIARLARRVPVVTMAGRETKASVNVRSDNDGAMRALARHLVEEHHYDTIAYLSGHEDSPDNITRAAAFAAEVTAAGARIVAGPAFQGDYSAAGGARVIRRLIDAGERLPRAIACANDQTALGVMYALDERGMSVPDDVAVTGFDDVPVARHLRPRLTTIRQPIQELGATAFDVLYSMINGNRPDERDIVLPTRLMVRASCGCAPEPAGRPTRPRER